eukprot:CAMPEP_0194047950 /NCGR_PEP_ID=MMETSP0009_2-20130614/26322_1 /TAXON_ID=210454 /ORGANISM="Grammatophora oceanica, Strain CCMP 410" /LENGTH=190 /DNA_ID=CAMNT_0038693719 /DNA_START=81 /DNA_END=653 /DNA_ORIENTATION=+
MKIFSVIALFFVAPLASAEDPAHQNQAGMMRQLMPEVDLDTAAWLGSRNFDVLIEGVGGPPQLLFRTVSQMETEMDVVDFMGRSNVNQKRPGDISYSNLVLTKRVERGKGHLARWYNSYVEEHLFEPREVKVRVKEDGDAVSNSATVMTLKFHQAFPVRYAISDLGKDVDGANPLLETIEVAYESVEVIF